MSGNHHDERVVVIGSLNADFIAHVERRPRAGETIAASATEERAGGKGGNQAAAAARAGAAVSFIGAVGADDLGTDQLRALRDLSVDVDRVIVTPGVATGRAFVTVTSDGENSIVVSLGANAHLHASDVRVALDRMPKPAVVLIQTETPVPTIEAVAEWCATRGVRLVLNNGPYRDLPSSTLRAANPLVLNEHEAREMCTEPMLSPRALAEAVHERSRARSVVVTLGSAGVQLRSSDESTLVPGVPIEHVVDTTGAGDTFVGTLAALLADGCDLERAASGATKAAAECVTWVGARPT